MKSYRCNIQHNGRSSLSQRWYIVHCAGTDSDSKTLGSSLQITLVPYCDSRDLKQIQISIHTVIK